MTTGGDGNFVTAAPTAVPPLDRCSFRYYSAAIHKVPFYERLI